jgi:xanthine dehydrogenase YagR molybdenum-binding subunit
LATAGPAVQGAARSIRTQLSNLEGARDGRNRSLVDLLHEAGMNHVDGRSERLAPGQTSEAMERARSGAVAIAGPEYPDFVSFSYIAHFAEVRVDPRIRRARVSRIVSVVDCGKVVSKRTATSQVYGGLVWGVGAALTEESEVDPRFGGFLNNNIAEYQIPVNADIGHLEVEFIDEPDPQLNSLGAKGMGEVASVGAAAAIANAVFHATGKRVRDLPIRVEKLFA